MPPPTSRSGPPPPPPPPQCPLRTLQFIGPPLSFRTRRTKSSSNGPKVKAPSSPGSAGPTRGRGHFDMGSLDYSKGRDGRWLGELQWSKANLEIVMSNTPFLCSRFSSPL